MAYLAGLKRWRERRVLSQGELATAAGVSRATVVDIEKQHVQPHPQTVRKLAKALRVAAEQLVEESEGD